MDKKWKFSRSHDQTYINCPRMGWLEFYYGGRGIVPRRLDLYQETGSLTHAILQAVMRFAQANGYGPGFEMLDGICLEAVDAYHKKVEGRGLTEVSGELELEMRRQAQLAEGLARAWTKRRLPLILTEYRVVAVEEEHEVEFAPGMILLSRPDTVLERLADRELIVGPEFKTTAWISNEYIESWRYATQTMGHCLDVESRFGRMPAGVLMEFLYKGMKKKGEDGSVTYYSPLVRAFKMVDNVTGEVIYGYDPALGRKKGWEVFDACAVGAGEWVDGLPDEVLDGMLFSSMIYRSPREMDEWKAQVVLRQRMIQEAVEVLNEKQPTVEAADEVLYKVFPARLDQFCFSNQYKKKCPYLPICYHEVDDPLNCGLYVVREPHHEGEFEEDT